MQSKNIKFCFLIPSRNRVNELTKTLYNILKKTYNPNCIEILLGIDKDDISSINFEIPYNLINKIKIKKIILERRGGYEDQPWRLKEMVKKSNSDFFIHFADDMDIIDYNWDKILSDAINNLPADRIYLIYPDHNQGNKDWPICQIISKEWFNTTNKFSNFYEVDTELLIISSILNRKYMINNFKIFHEFNSMKEKDTTFIEGREKTLKYKFNKKSILSISSLFKVFKDVEILENKIKNRNNQTFLVIFRVILLFLKRIYWINKNYKLNYIKIFIKNFIYLKI